MLVRRLGCDRFGADECAALRVWIESIAVESLTRVLKERTDPE